jgi:hypothetical protein
VAWIYSLKRRMRSADLSCSLVFGDQAVTLPELVAEPGGIVVGIVIVGLSHGGTPLLLCSDFGIQGDAHSYQVTIQFG